MVVFLARSAAPFPSPSPLPSAGAASHVAAPLAARATSLFPSPPMPRSVRLHVAAQLAQDPVDFDPAADLVLASLVGLRIPPPRLGGSVLTDGAIVELGRRSSDGRPCGTTGRTRSPQRLKDQGSRPQHRAGLRKVDLRMYSRLPSGKASRRRFGRCSAASSLAGDAGDTRDETCQLLICVTLQVIQR